MIEPVNNEESFQSVNVYPLTDGRVRVIGYKSLAGLIQVIRRVDKNCKKYGYRTRLMIDFPIEKNQEKQFKYTSKKLCQK